MAPLFIPLLTSIGKAVLTQVAVNTVSRVTNQFLDRALGKNLQLQPLLPNPTPFNINVGTSNNASIGDTLNAPLRGSALEERLLNTYDSLEKRMDDLAARLNDPNLSLGQVAKVQADLAKLTTMMQLISTMLSKKAEIEKHVISNMR